MRGRRGVVVGAMTGREPDVTIRITVSASEPGCCRTHDGPHVHGCILPGDHDGQCQVPEPAGPQWGGFDDLPHLPGGF
jgi:hypothetical protein